jgi:hypothetical protein
LRRLFVLVLDDGLRQFSGLPELASRNRLPRPSAALRV